MCLTHWAKSKGKRAWASLQEAIEGSLELEAATLRELLELLRRKPRGLTVPGSLDRLLVGCIHSRQGFAVEDQLAFAARGTDLVAGW